MISKKVVEHTVIARSTGALLAAIVFTVATGYIAYGMYKSRVFTNELVINDALDAPYTSNAIPEVKKHTKTISMATTSNNEQSNKKHIFQLSDNYLYFNSNANHIEILTPIRETIRTIQPTSYKIALDYEVMNGDLSDDDLLDYIKYNNDFLFRYSLYMTCSACYESIVFYERNMKGVILSGEQVKEFMGTSAFLNIYINITNKLCDKHENHNLLHCIELNISQEMKHE